MNHRRSTSRRPRGSRSERRGRRVKHAAQALAAGAAIAAGTQAYADPIRFDNPLPGQPGHFDWAVIGIRSGLDIAQSPGSQPGGDGGSTVFEQYVQEAGLFGGVYAPPGGGVEVGGYADYFLDPVAPGALIPGGDPWQGFGFTSYVGYGSELPDGLRAYLGLRFDPGDGMHYGWIGVVRDDLELDAFAWGYETEPGVPIPGTPEPGTLAMLALGAGAVAARRRRGGEARSN